MKNLVLTTLCVLLSSIVITAQSAFINEINYLSSNPTERGVEIAGEAGSSLSGWSLVAYTAEGTVAFTEYLTDALIPDDQNGNGVVWYDVEQGSGGGGIALVNVNQNVVQFLSYGTENLVNLVINAVEGPASGMVSSYVGTQLDEAQSLQLTGTGLEYLDFTWLIPGTSTAGDVNTNQYFGLPLLAAANADQSLRMNTIRNIVPEWNIFPNPTTDYITLNWKENFPTASYIILYDGNGQQISFDKAASGQFDFTINMTALAPGQYYLQFKNGNTTWTQAVVKQ